LEGISKSTAAMIHRGSTSPCNTAAILAFPTGKGKAAREIRVPGPSLRVSYRLQQRWISLGKSLLQCSYLVHSCSAHLLQLPLREASSSFFSCFCHRAAQQLHWGMARGTQTAAPTATGPPSTYEAIPWGFAFQTGAGNCHWL